MRKLHRFSGFNANYTRRSIHVPWLIAGCRPSKTLRCRWILKRITCLYGAVFSFHLLLPFDINNELIFVTTI
jgi:hypothetical protein